MYLYIAYMKNTWLAKKKS